MEENDVSIGHVFEVIKEAVGNDPIAPDSICSRVEIDVSTC